MKFILTILYLSIAVPPYIDLLSGCPSTPTSFIAGLCNLAVTAVGLPWTFLIIRGININPSDNNIAIVGFISILLNTILLYYIGKMISKLGAAMIRKIIK